MKIESVKNKVKFKLRKFYDSPESLRTRKLMSKKRKLYLSKFENRQFGERNGMYNKKHNKETREKMSRSIKKNYEVNPNTKKLLSKRSKEMWENKTEEQIKIFKEKQSKVRAIPVIGFTLDLKYLMIFKSSAEAARKLGLDKNCILNNIYGYTSHSGGYVWRRYDKNLLHDLLERKKNNNMIKHELRFNRSKTIKYYKILENV